MIERQWVTYTVRFQSKKMWGYVKFLEHRLIDIYLN